MAGSYFFGIVINKFGYKKELSLVILFKIDKSLKIGFHCTIVTIGLTVNLKIKSGKEFSFNAKKLTKQ